MNYNILPAIRKDKKDSKGLVPIYIFIYDTNIKAKISLGHKIDPDHWDEKERRVKRKVENANLINGLIEKNVRDIKAKIIAEQILRQDTAINVSELFKKDKIKDVSFYDFAEKQIVQKNYREETRRAYRVYIEKLKNYRKTLRLTEIDFEFLQGYEFYLRETLKNSSNTIWGNFKFINTMTNDAIKMKMLTEDPFKTFKRINYKNPKKDFLTSAELAKIENYVGETEDEGVKLVGKYFLFMAFTGLRHSDAIRFNISEHVVNGERIVMETQKTMKETNLYINEIIRPYMEYVDANPIKITQVEFNRRLKIIAAGAGIKKKVSSHTARHSFGSSLADLGIPMEVAQGLLSHGSIASTKIYYHLKSTNLDDAMRKLGQKRK